MQSLRKQRRVGWSRTTAGFPLNEAVLGTHHPGTQGEASPREDSVFHLSKTINNSYYIQVAIEATVGKRPQRIGAVEKPPRMLTTPPPPPPLAYDCKGHI